MNVGDHLVKAFEAASPEQLRAIIGLLADAEVEKPLPPDADDGFWALGQSTIRPDVDRVKQIEVYEDSLEDQGVYMSPYNPPVMTRPEYDPTNVTVISTTCEVVE